MLKVREDHVSSVLDEARRRLGEVTKDQAKYSEVLLTLIVQGLFQIMEPNTIIKTRQVDQELVQSLLPKAVEQYKEKMGKDVSLKLETTSFLGADTCGGVELSALNGRIRVSKEIDFSFFVLPSWVLRMGSRSRWNGSMIFRNVITRAMNQQLTHTPFSICKIFKSLVSVFCVAATSS